jgi:phenylacetate-coenzyme A ligase PaaK-like adenylate-forming protein
MKNANAYIFGKTLSRKTPWTASEVEKICLDARARAAKLRAEEPAYILDTLAAVGALYADKKGVWYREAFAHVREASQFSDETIAASLEVLPHIFDRAELEKRLRLELSLPGALDACVSRQGYDGFVTAVPRGTVLHVGAGNIFLGIIDSLLMGMLTRNANIVKTASGGAVSTVSFAQALKRADKKGLLASSIAVLSWPGGAGEIESAAARSVNAIFVWGGEEAVAAYRRVAPSTVHVTGFGPKMSAAVVLPSALEFDGMAVVGEKMARDVSVWEQSACASPHTVFVVDPKLRKSDPLAGDFVKAVAAGFRNMQRQLPQGTLSMDEQVEITRARELARIDMGVGEAKLESAFPQTHWTVIAEKNTDFKISPLNRTLYVKCVASLADVEKAVAQYRGYVQTVGVAGTLKERMEIARMLAPYGVARVTELGKMLEGPTGSPHDGIFPMRELVWITGIEGSPGPVDELSELVDFARGHSPFYRKHFSGVGKIVSAEGFRKVPFLTKENILSNTPPDSEAMFTGPITAGIYFASGGSTGNPKYIFFNGREHDRVSRVLGRGFVSAGLTAQDRAANLFVSGNLWSSWLGVERALARTPAISVPIGSALPLENIAEYLCEFKVTAIIGLPSFLLKLAQYCEAHPEKKTFPLGLLFYGGEYVGREMENYFRKVFPGVKVRSAGYATVDAGVIGYQCPHCEGSEHHLFESEQYLEILDPETGNPVSGRNPGELVITVLHKRHMPIIRFRVGDLGRWVEGDCPCGRKDRRFEILGRCDDRIHAGGAHIFVNDIARAIEAVPGLSFAFQVEISKRGVQDHVKLRVEMKEPGEPGARARQLSEAIRQNCEDLVYSLDMKWLDEPEIEILPPNTIERVARTGKIRKVKDLRIKP